MKTRKAYVILLDDNGVPEYNLEEELLVFDNYDQIAEYAKANDINLERISVTTIDVEEFDDTDFSNVPEVEF